MQNNCEYKQEEIVHKEDYYVCLQRNIFDNVVFIVLSDNN